MTNQSLALAEYESLTAHSTSPRILQTGYLLLAAAAEVHHVLRQKYMDRAEECFARCGYALPDSNI